MIKKLDTIIIIQPFGKDSGHTSKFSNNLYDFYKKKFKEIILLTYDGLIDYETNKNIIKSSKYLPRIINNLIQFGRKNQILFFGSILSLICQIHAYLLTKKKEQTLLYIADSTIQISIILNLIFRHKFVVHYVHTYKQLVFYLNSQEKVKSKINNIIYNLAVKSSILFLVPQTILEKKHSNFYMGKIIPTKWGIESKKTEIVNKMPKRTINEPYILVFGPNHSSKNYDIIYRLCNNYINSNLIVFAGKLNNKKKNNINKLNIQNNLKVKIINKFFTDNEIEEVFTHALFVILSYSKDFSGTCSIFNFALRYNIPVLVSDSTGLSEIIKEKKLGMIFKADDFDDFMVKYTIFEKNIYRNLKFYSKNMKEYFIEMNKNNNWNYILKKEFIEISNKYEEI